MSRYKEVYEGKRREWLMGLQQRDTYLIGLINTAYTIGAILAGWFLGGPVVSFSNNGACIGEIF